MNRIATMLSLAAAFAAGCSVTHLLRPAVAAENIAAQVIHTGELEGDALGMPSGTGMRSKMFVSADGMTISIQDGNVGKHMHPNTNEIQYILDGTGTRARTASSAAPLASASVRPTRSQHLTAS